MQSQERTVPVTLPVAGTMPWLTVLQLVRMADNAAALIDPGAPVLPLVFPITVSFGMFWRSEGAT